MKGGGCHEEIESHEVQERRLTIRTDTSLQKFKKGLQRWRLIDFL